MRVEIETDGPFSLPLMLRQIGRRPNEIVDVIWDGAYQRLLLVRGRPVLLSVGPGSSPSAVALSVRREDGEPDAADLAAAETAIRRVFSFDSSPLPFYAHVATDPVLGPLSVQLRGLRPVCSPSIFEMLVYAILGQQISLIAAGAIKSRMVRGLGASAAIDGHTYHAFPAAETLAEISMETLLSYAFSRRKAEYIRDLARQVATGALDLEAMRALPRATILERLLALRGIGRWTAEYALLRGYGDADALLAGDAGLRRQIWRLYALPAPPTKAEIITLAARWAPYRSWATFYLWNAGLDMEATLPPPS